MAASGAQPDSKLASSGLWSHRLALGALAKFATCRNPAEAAHMMQLRRMIGIAAVTAISGCQTVPLTTTLQPVAIDFVLQRARFDMNCPTATASVLSSMTVQPPARVIMMNQ